MRFLLKILFAPILAVLAVVSWFLVFVVGLSSAILCIPAAILGFFGLFIIFVDSVSYGVGLLVIAFLISPTDFPCWRAGWWQSSISCATRFRTGFTGSIVFRNAQNISKSYIFARFQERHITQQARSISPRALLIRH